MKTTILASAALLFAGTLLSNAASVISDPLNDESLVYYWDFSTDSSPVKTVTGTTWSDLPTHNSAGYGSFTSSAGRMWSTTLSAGNIAANSFTVSLDFANFQANNWTDLLTIYTGGTVSDLDHSLQIQKTDSDALAVYAGTADDSGNITSTFGGATVRAAGVVANGVIGVGAWQTLTLTSDGTHLCAYVDGELAQTFDLDATSTNITGLQVGSGFGIDNNGNPIRAANSGDIDNLAIWNRALSADEVRSLVIPEPSAFGLLAGAGALALVASRRRRAK